MTEPPDGIKANMIRAYSSISEKNLEIKNKPEWKSIIFILSMFHAVIQERFKYGPLGWNVVYEFNETDFIAAKSLLKDLLNSNVALSCEAFVYIIANINYGGRVDYSFI